MSLPPTNDPYPFLAISHESRIQEIHLHLPLAIKLNEVNRRLSYCIRCDTCDGFPCLVNGKADADINCMRPTSDNWDNVSLLTEAQVLKLHTNESGREISKVEVLVQGQRVFFLADIVVVACGAINSAVLLLRSANDKHPYGLANSSDQVGRNFMRHQNGAIIGLTRKSNPTIFQKTLAVNDFYWGEAGFDYPMGHVQLLGKVNKDTIALDAPIFALGLALEEVAKRSVDWWLTAEDLPDPNNRVSIQNGDIYLDYTDNNTEAFDRLLNRWTEVLKSIECGDRILPCSLYFRKRIPLQGVVHQCGTCRFGEDPQTSVLNLDCRTHDVENLYVVDGSFFRSSAAVNPTLTIIANALRVGDRILERLK
jgi:choline dehydrogenase-like flavoprotein